VRILAASTELRSVEGLQTNMWLFLRDGRMMRELAMSRRVALVARAGRPEIATQKDKAVVPDEASATLLRVPSNSISYG
jgi:hypothetical protein